MFTIINYKPELHDLQANKLIAHGAIHHGAAERLVPSRNGMALSPKNGVNLQNWEWYHVFIFKKMGVIQKWWHPKFVAIGSSGSKNDDDRPQTSPDVGEGLPWPWYPFAGMGGC